ncbi:helix-turn-helix domain-containing protein [Cupriavidus taiwanensis]|uniref:Transcriptional regulator, XRE family, bacteriophage lambda repressor C1 like n=1 Tax=Cupriavidus taiwanensis (strain DSM 17343 / BCRC 17206 / CCUG 44338 / CIP 107171 / LMG 19424 / R1) TaxID=977880 RepID=B3R3M2_CUPTR|nr:helix-turn-helix transcriptional regulator [Cupriavidus taiwanensis]CAQ68905.1 putative transcriptional regulator, XRE family, bacteriophage lambda repressor C1 like [Cupriavidus taiwanensis LMG 19424]
MLTSFGRFLRELRHQHTELMKDMADKLGVSAAFLSAVETGKKSIPPTWTKSLTDAYKLPPAAVSQMQSAIDASARSVTIDLANQSEERRSAAVALARQFGDLSDDQLASLKQAMLLLKRRGDGK